MNLTNIFKFDPEQPRAEDGKWVDFAGGKDKEPKGKKRRLASFLSKAKSFMNQASLAGVAEAGGNPSDFAHMYKFENIFKV